MQTIPTSISAPIPEGSDRRPGHRQHGRPRPPAEALGLPPLLAGRASQHARHRLLRDLGRHRPRRAARPRPSASGQGASCSRTMPRSSSPSSSARSRPSTRTGSISASAAPPAPTWQSPAPSAATWPRGQLPRRTCRNSSPTSADTRRPRPRHPGQRHEGPRLDPRLQPLRRATGGLPRPPLRLRLPLRPRPPGTGAGGLPPQLPPLPPARHTPLR